MELLPQLVDAGLEIDGRVATLVLDRPEVRNELTGTKLVDDIVRTVEWLNRNEEVSVLIVTGEGKAFSAGGNVKDMQKRRGSFGGDVYQVQANYRHGIQRIALSMESLEIPSICAVNGAAIGAGFDLACMCDIRLISDRAKLGSTFVNLGIVPGDGGAWFLPRLVGPQRAAELILTGRVIDAAEALRIGLALEVLEPDRLMERSREMASVMAAKPPRALRMAKRLLRQSSRMELAGFLELCGVYQGICHNTQEHAEAIAAFVAGLGERPAKAEV